MLDDTPNLRQCLVFICISCICIYILILLYVNHLFLPYAVCIVCILDLNQDIPKFLQILVLRVRKDNGQCCKPCASRIGAIEIKIGGDGASVYVLSCLCVSGRSSS